MQAFRHSFQHHSFSRSLYLLLRETSHCTDETQARITSACGRQQAREYALQDACGLKANLTPNLQKLPFPALVGNTFLGLPSQRIVKVVCSRKPQQRSEDLFGCGFHLKVARREIVPSLR